MFRSLFSKNSFKYYKPIKYPPCGRKYCYCIKTTDMNNKINIKNYLECYKHWYNYIHM